LKSLSFTFDVVRRNLTANQKLSEFFHLLRALHSHSFGRTVRPVPDSFEQPIPLFDQISQDLRVMADFTEVPNTRIALALNAMPSL
jgi:hypothetical protein